MSKPFTPADRSYFVSDERLLAFKALSPMQRLAWVEQLSMFLRLAKVGQGSENAGERALASSPDQKP